MSVFIVNMWEVRKQNLYGNDSCPKSQSSIGGLGGTTGQRHGELQQVSLIVYVTE